MDLEQRLSYLERLFELSKKYGLNHFKDNDLEFHFNLTNNSPNTIQNDNKTISKESVNPVASMTEEIIPDEDMLLWSTDSYQQEKEEQLNGSIN